MIDSIGFIAIIILGLVGYAIGYSDGKENRVKRDARGRFIK